MIKIVAQSVVKDEYLSEYIVLAHELVEKSRAEKGCIEYGLWQSIDNPCQVCMIEAWADADAIARHNATEHFTRIVPRLGSMRVSSNVVKYAEL